MAKWGIYNYYWLAKAFKSWLLPGSQEARKSSFWLHKRLITHHVQDVVFWQRQVVCPQQVDQHNLWLHLFRENMKPSGVVWSENYCTTHHCKRPSYARTMSNTKWIVDIRTGAVCKMRCMIHVPTSNSVHWPFLSRTKAIRIEL